MFENIFDDNDFICFRVVSVVQWPKSLDSYNLVSEFEFQLCYYVHFRIITLGKGMNPLITHT